MKSQKEKQFDALLDKYYDTFGQNYPLCITSMLSTEEHIARINKAISDKKPVVDNLNPDYIY